MWCSSARRRLSAYLDGELRPDRVAAVEAHLARCASCAAALAQLRAEWDVLAELGCPPLPAALGARIEQAALTPARRADAGHRPPRLAFGAAIGLGAAAGLALGFAAIFGVRGPEPTGAPGADVERTLVVEAFGDLAAVPGLEADPDGAAPGAGRMR